MPYSDPNGASAADLLGRASELEQMADLVSYGGDKARLRERARQLRRQAEQAAGDAGKGSGGSRSVPLWRARSARAAASG